LLWLNGEIGSGAGDVAGGAEYRPTDNEVDEVHDIEQKLVKAEADYDNLMKKEVPAFNHTLAEHNVTPIVAGGMKAKAPGDPNGAAEDDDDEGANND
jgi:hypothetical protein